MALLGSLNTGASGVKTQGKTMQVVGNNIANVNTFGFKSNKVAFEDLMGNAWPQGATFTKASNGVKIGGVQMDHSQGAFETTTLSTDLAIAGGGFFTIVNPSTGKESYTRNGQFSYDKEGYLSTLRGGRLQALKVDRITGDSKGIPGALQVLGLVDAPQPTGTGHKGTGIKLAANLDANASVKDVPVDPTNVLDNMYNFATSTTVYDALGNSHTATVAMRKRPDLPEQIDPGTGQPIAGTGVSNQWEYYVMFDGSSLGQVPGTMVAVGGGFMQFTDDGKLIAATGGSFEAQPGGVDEDGQPLPAGPPRLIPQPVDPDTGVPQFAIPFGGGAPLVIGLHLGDGFNPDDPTDPRSGLDGITQFAGHYNVLRTSADGNPAGILESIFLEDNGTVNGVFDAGYTRAIGRIVLTKFDNPGKLAQVGENMLVETLGSGKKVTAEPGTAGFGEIRSKSLEQSNVDLSQEFVKMVETQRAFQASAKTVTTSDEMIQDLINMKR
ncbi:MAG TPA: flagellar hook protein FlgE [Candidatus Lambdaproteobacteria bacterium]|nr:flagellar hook protein FlgE [Candidatus Lambdaproteobacteria bacterium]HIB46540.1 flagellar hook protein FlgE [Candidatus Lambdaproteobacteria bacterium]HIB94727.1 flagellar hook protein FlgE [Candidatus Lambdaproteobacteria bacterium]HIN48633.1 flagellar hook protein FlgE [Deltaproteobacteria bacterium]HIO82418.1 flagellar hook protein FlgE [Deltaproteobacteria bacterium]